MSPTIAVIGEIVADAVLPPDGIVDGVAHLAVHPGGGPANTAVALARLGTTARFAGRLSGGALGALCRAKLEASGVDLTRIGIVVDNPPPLPSPGWTPTAPPATSSTPKAPPTGAGPTIPRPGHRRTVPAIRRPRWPCTPAPWRSRCSPPAPSSRTCSAAPGTG